VGVASVAKEIGFCGSIVALDAATGKQVWVFNAPPGGGETAPVDVGFSASPNLFTVTIDGVERDLVGEGQKSGDYWALDRDTGEVVWQATVSPPSFLGDMEGTSAVANGIVTVSATDWPEFDRPATPCGAAHDTPTASPAAISADAVVQSGMDGILHVYGLTDGAELFSADLGASVSGGIAVADGIAVLGAATPAFAPFVKSGSSMVAFAVGGGGATPTA
jgi:polyvinyl alcohol dehydrogenase (cytochrome)